MVRLINMWVALLLAGSAYAQNYKLYTTESSARACINKGLAEWTAQNQRYNIADDPAITACTRNLRTEITTARKSDCEATDYIGWVITSENSKLNKLAGTTTPYRRNAAFIKSCESSASGGQR